MIDDTRRTGGRLPLWGGLECSVVRLGDGYRDQLAETGHWDRIEDLDAIAALGIRTLRYPILWEHVSPHTPDQRDWSWHDARLNRLAELGIEPIVGLVHHGSGPRYTNLLDPAFAEGLAAHAAAVAERYPWVSMFTPVNEPLTTARFSGLYGHWYPHRSDEASFLRMLFNQCRAVMLSMAAIRRVNPSAQLIQTEDMGKVWAVPRLQYQADFENERRWLSFDLLCGRVGPHHPLHERLRSAGIRTDELAALVDEAVAPDILGINHYLTSERFLDSAFWSYRPEFHGGNGTHRYADVEAVRMLHLEPDVGPAARLREVWERYGLPIAVTEAHHFCTEDEQARWLLDVWDAATEVARDGADIRAVTIWSLFGAVDWSSLLTERAGVYEQGAFDIRTAPPRPTLLAEIASDLTREGRSSGRNAVPVGWWRRGERVYEPMRRKRAG